MRSRGLVIGSREKEREEKEREEKEERRAKEAEEKAVKEKKEGEERERQLRREEMADERQMALMALLVRPASGPVIAATTTQPPATSAPCQDTRQILIESPGSLDLI